MKNAFGKEFQIEPETYQHFEQLRQALKKKGIQVELDSVYRSVARQKEIVANFFAIYIDIVSFWPYNAIKIMKRSH